jgi:hypothetical protein
MRSDKELLALLDRLGTDFLKRPAEEAPKHFLKVCGNCTREELGRLAVLARRRAECHQRQAEEFTNLHKRTKPGQCLSERQHRILMDRLRKIWGDDREGFRKSMDDLQNTLEALRSGKEG